jgi:hypothetical protein
MSRSLKFASVGLLALLAGLILARAAARAPLNRKVLAFAKSRTGKKVGNGQCWTLANAALRAAGARQPRKGGYGNYVFGRRVALKAVQPGDILQFEKVSFKHTEANGRWFTQTFGHHTAIVSAVNGRTITLLHQNVGGVKRVKVGKINLADRQRGGSIIAFRPQRR